MSCEQVFSDPRAACSCRCRLRISWSPLTGVCPGTFCLQETEYIREQDRHHSFQIIWEEIKNESFRSHHKGYASEYCR